MDNLKKILDQANQYLGVNKSKHPTDTLATTFHIPAGEEKRNVWFV